MNIEAEEIEAVTSDPPTHVTYWTAVYRYSPGGEWYTSACLKHTQREVLADLMAAGGERHDVKLVAIQLPITT